MRTAWKPLILTPIVALVFVACQTVPKTIPTTLTESEYFHKAEDYSGVENYAAALKYYNTFLDRYPDDKTRGVEADYEIAFIAYKTGDLEKAKTLFTALTLEYKKPGGDALPRWPLVLSNKLLIVIANETKPKVPASTPTPAPAPQASAAS